MTSRQPAAPRWIAVAEIARPHGVRGELRLRVYSGDPALLLRRPPIQIRKKAADEAATERPAGRPAIAPAGRPAIAPAGRPAIAPAGRPTIAPAGRPAIAPARIKSARPVDKAILIELDGVADRNAAEELRGAEILVERSQFAPLEEGEFYACDLEGARAELTTGELVGTVTGLGTYPTCDVLLIDREGTRLEVPIVPQFVESVDTSAGLVKLITLEGLA